MPRKFIYGPGLPGYGTKGVDGSTGLQGVATYFSAYDGNSDSNTIKSKIENNWELFSGSNSLPDGRSYITGDIFIDKNAKIFQIDLAIPSLYSDTGIFLNTTVFFSSGPVQESAPKFSRYSNAFETSKFLIDTVYTDAVGDYAAYPVNLYMGLPDPNSDAKYFARLNYVDPDMASVNLNNWYAFDIWTIGNKESPGNADKDAIALTREYGINTWHFGNRDGDGILRTDSSLYLDFGDFYFPGIDASGVSTDFLTITSDGKLIKSTVATMIGWAGDDTAGNIAYYNGEAMEIERDNNLKWISDTSTLMVSGKLTVTGDTSLNDLFLDSLEFIGDASNYIISNSPLIIQTKDVSSFDDVSINFDTNNLYFTSGDVAGSFGGGTGNVYIATGRSGDNSGLYAVGKPGDINITAGTPGTSTTYNIPASAPLDGGDITIRTGDGGDSTHSYQSDYNGGDGGKLLIRSGDGGYAAGGWKNDGDGGKIEITAGNGGITPGVGETGDGGTITITGGKAKANLGSYYGTGGDVSIKAGNTEQREAWGGDMFIAAGDGKNVADGGNGGNVTILGGNGDEGPGGNISLIGGEGKHAGNQCGNITLTAGVGQAAGLFWSFAHGGDITLNRRIVTGDYDGEIYIKNLSIVEDKQLAINESSGAISISAGGSSDIRLKDIDSSISNTIEKIETLTGFKFRWNSLGAEAMKVDVSILHYGLSAQDVELVFPELVDDFKGNNNERYKNIEYPKFAPIFVEAFKEQQIEINNLKNDVSTLTSTILNLVSRIEILEEI